MTDAILIGLGLIAGVVLSAAVGAASWLLWHFWGSRAHLRGAAA